MTDPSGDGTRSPSLAAVNLEEKDLSSCTSPAPSIAPAEALRDAALTESPADAELPDTANAFKPTWRFYLTFISLAVITLTAALDATSLSVALPIITDVLGGTAIEAFWSGTSFLLTSTVLQPTFASMSQIFGRKPLLYIALAFFAVGALLAGISNNFTMMLVGRSLQGVGGGGIIALTEIIVTDLVPLRFRGAWFGYLSSMWAVGSVSGPLIGGALAQNGAWRWIFYLNLPLTAAGFAMLTFFLKLNFVVGSFGEKLGRFDWIGAILFISSTTSIMIPVTWGGVSYPWDSWHTLVPLMLGITGIVAFGIYERYFAAEPMMPSTIFSNWALRITYFTTVIHGMILWSLLYYIPLYYEAVKGYSPIITGMLSNLNIISASSITDTAKASLSFPQHSLSHPHPSSSA
jgi:MFS family permease